MTGLVEIQGVDESKYLTKDRLGGRELDAASVAFGRVAQRVSGVRIQQLNSSGRKRDECPDQINDER